MFSCFLKIWYGFSKDKLQTNKVIDDVFGTKTLTDLFFENKYFYKQEKMFKLI